MMNARKATAVAEDRRLIDEALSGDEWAYSALYGRHSGRIARTIRLRIRNRDQVDDLLQVTFIRAFRSLEGFRADAALSTWLTRIALNVCSSEAQAARGREIGALGMAEAGSLADVTGCGATEADPEYILERKQQKAMLHRAIRKLPSHYRRAMWLRYVEDRSYREIGQTLRVPMGTVKTWLCRGRRSLRNVMAGSPD